jgi:hypothetical protein
MASPSKTGEAAHQMMRSHRYSVDNARYCVLLAHNSQVLVVGLVILDSSRSLFYEGGWPL